MIDNSRSISYVFIDAPNVDMVLGADILGRRPKPNERPRWERILVFARTELRCVKPTFVLNGNRFAKGGYPIFALRRALRFMGYDVQCPFSRDGSDPVDACIRQNLRTIARYYRPCSVAIITHDGGYAADLAAILMLGGFVRVIGFPAEMAPELLQLKELGAEIIDLELDLGAFNGRLSRPLLA